MRQNMEGYDKITSLVLSLVLCQMVNAMPALTLPATITVNAAGGGGGGAGGAGGGREGGVGGSSPNLDAISSSIGSNIQAAAQQLMSGEMSSQNGQLNAASVGGTLSVDGLQGLTGLTSGSVSGLASSGLGLTSGGLHTFSLTSGSGNGAGISSAFSTSGSNGADSGSSSLSSSLDAENRSQGGIRNGLQQLSPNGQLVTTFVTRTQEQNDGVNFDNNGQRFVSFGSRPEGFPGSSANVVPQGSWVIDVGSLGDTTSAPNGFPVNRFAEQSSPSFLQPIWSARQQATIRSPINTNYLQEYIVPQRPAPSLYYTVPDVQSSNSSPARSLGYVARSGDGLQLQYTRNGGGVYGGPIAGQGYFTGGQVFPAQQFQLAF